MWMFLALALADPTSRTARIPGEPEVAAYPDQTGTAFLVVDCLRRKPTLYVEVPFAADVSGTYEDAWRAEVQLRFDLEGAETVKARTDRAPGQLHIPAAKRWLRRLAAAESVEFTYTPFASPPTFTRFEVASVVEQVGDLTETCGL